MNRYKSVSRQDRDGAGTQMTNTARDGNVELHEMKGEYFWKIVLTVFDTLELQPSRFSMRLQYSQNRRF